MYKVNMTVKDLDGFSLSIEEMDRMLRPDAYQESTDSFLMESLDKTMTDSELDIKTSPNRYHPGTPARFHQRHKPGGPDENPVEDWRIKYNALTARLGIVNGWVSDDRPVVLAETYTDRCGYAPPDVTVEVMSVSITGGGVDGVVPLDQILCELGFDIDNAAFAAAAYNLQKAYGAAMGEPAPF